MYIQKRLTFAENVQKHSFHYITAAIETAFLFSPPRKSETPSAEICLRHESG